FPYGIVNGSLSHLTVDGNGSFWFTIDGGADQIGRLTVSTPPSGPAVGTYARFVIPTENRPTVSPIFSNPQGIAAGPDGNLWFTEFNGNQIGRISPSGTVTEFSLPTGLGEPTAIAAGPDGNLWFTEFEQNQVGLITPAGQVEEFSIGSFSMTPTDIAVGPD